MHIQHAVALKPQKQTLSAVEEFENTKALCQKLLETPHYKKMGEEGVFAIVQTCKSIGIDPLRGLNKGMYCVRGAVEMSSRLMNSLIRSKKHSITKDKRSDDTICILHGRRADNGDTWSASFSLKEAELAGLTKNPSWRTCPSDMLFARALSRLARQLFPDVIGNCYVEGEISDAPPLHEPLPEIPSKEEVEEIEAESSSEGLDVRQEYFTWINDLVGTDKERLENILSFFDVNDIQELTTEKLKWLVNRLEESNRKKAETEESETVQV